ncbi:MAG: hypothetical protein ACE5FO_09835 [Parvularculaceae bacterium]
MSAPSRDAAARVEALIDLTEKLTAIFMRENDLLATRRPRELAPLQAEKAHLAAVYAQSIRDIANDRGLVDNAGAALLGKLRAITANFEARASEQRALLDGARLAAEGVVRAIADEAADADAAPGYDDRKTDKPVAVSIDENA